MKKLILPIILCLFIFAGQAWADPPIGHFTIQNPGFSANYKFYIDIYGDSDYGEFTLGYLDLGIQFNDLVLSNPVLSLQNSDFHDNTLYDPMSVSAASSTVIRFVISAKGSSGTILPDEEIRLARITFDINPATYDTETSGIAPTAFGTHDIEDADGVSGVVDFTGTHDVSLDCVPSISGSPSTSIVDGNYYSFTPTPSGGCTPFTFDIQNQPSWALFNINTGELYGTATPDGTYSSIIITVKDADGSDIDDAALASFNIQVTSGCVAPTISGTPENFIKVGESYSFTPTVSNGCSTLVYSVNNPNGLDSWATLNTSTGELSGTPVAADVDEYTGIIITVTDNNGTGNSDDLTFDLEVCEATTISGTPATSVVAGQPYSFTPVYTGCGNPTFEIDNRPEWASFDTSTGALTGTPAAVDVGTDEDIVIRVEDQKDDSASLPTFDIEVTASSNLGGGGGSSGGGGCFISTVQP